MRKSALKEKVINKIRETEDEGILAEVYRLLELESEDLEIYKLSKEQIFAIEDARTQIKKGEFLTNEQADKEIDEWLGN